MRIKTEKKYIITIVKKRRCIMEKNFCIECDVKSCRHNVEGKNCQLGSIKVTCGCGDQCTCCGDYQQK